MGLNSFDKWFNLNINNINPKDMNRFIAMQKNGVRDVSELKSHQNDCRCKTKSNVHSLPKLWEIIRQDECNRTSPNTKSLREVQTKAEPWGHWTTNLNRLQQLLKNKWWHWRANYFGQPNVIQNR
jgi:dihydroorotate dehydrogenase